MPDAPAQPTPREVTLILGLVVEKRPSLHPWAQWVWSAVAVYLPPEPAPPNWTVLREDGAVTRYHAGCLPLVLHRKDAPALRETLMLEPPQIYAVLHASEGGAFPWVPHLITASPYEAQDAHDSDDALIEKLAMPDPVAAFVQAFVARQPDAEPFKKRRRDRLDVEERKFGKAPIFVPVTRQ